jgi:hypothetical protein
MRHHRRVTVNRAPVLVLWAAVVAHRLGFAWDEALTLGRVVAGLNANAKGRALGLFQPSPARTRAARRQKAKAERLRVELLHRAVPVARTKAGLRALSKGKPIAPQSVERYLHGKFGEAYGDVRRAMAALARSRPPGLLARQGFGLYEKFRPAVARGVQGWGAKGRLDTSRILALAAK